MTYLLTFACYGTYIPGARKDVVSRKRNQIGDPYVMLNPGLASNCTGAMREPPYILDKPCGEAVLEAMISVCKFRGWHAHCIHARTTHVHAVVTANQEPERMLIDFKAYASRSLNETRLDAPNRIRWARHGSTQYLWDEPSIAAAIRYVACDQGEPMALYLYSRAPVAVSSRALR